MSISRGVPAPAEVARPAPPPVRIETVVQLRGGYTPLREGQTGRVESPIKPGASNIDQRLIEGRKAADELLSFEQQDQDPSRVFDQARRSGMSSLTTVERQSLSRVDQKLADEAAQFDSYSSIITEASKTGKTADEIARSRGLDFTSLRGDVVGRMSGMDYFRQIIPGYDRMDKDTQMRIVEHYFATDDLVRESYIRQMKEIAVRAAAIPESSVGSASAARQSEVAGERKAAGERIRTRLGEAGKNLTDDEIAEMFKGGHTVEEVRAQIFDRALSDRGIDAQAVRTRDKARSVITRIHGQLRSIEQQLSGNPSNREELVEQQSKLQTQLQEAQATESKIVISADQEAIIAKVDQQVYGFTDDRAGGVKTGGIEAELRNIAQALATESKLMNAELTPEQQAAETQRQLQLEALQREMQGAMENAVDQMLRQNYEDATDLQARKTEADAVRLEKEGQDRLAEAERRSLRRQDEEWVGKDKDKRRRIVHRDQIGADIKRVAEDGEDGVRRIMLRQLSGGENPLIELTGPDGQMLQGYGPDNKPLVDASGKPVPATWETVRMEDLREADRNLLNQLYDRQHVQLEDRLLRDFDFAKHPRGLRDSFNLLGSANALRLTKDEYGYLHEQFGDRLEKAADASEAMRNITAELKAKGIEPKGLMGLLMMLLALSGGMSKKIED